MPPRRRAIGLYKFVFAISTELVYYVSSCQSFMFFHLLSRFLCKFKYCIPRPSSVRRTVCDVELNVSVITAPLAWKPLLLPFFLLSLSQPFFLLLQAKAILQNHKSTSFSTNTALDGAALKAQLPSARWKIGVIWQNGGTFLSPVETISNHSQLYHRLSAPRWTFFMATVW